MIFEAFTCHKNLFEKNMNINLKIYNCPTNIYSIKRGYSVRAAYESNAFREALIQIITPINQNII